MKPYPGSSAGKKRNHAAPIGTPAAATTPGRLGGATR